jgi:hypothetical protein
VARCSRPHIDGASVALAIYAVTCCAVAMCLAFGFYELMKPARFANPGLAAYKPPHSTVINLVGPVPPVPLPPADLITVSIKPPAQVLDVSAAQRQTKPKRIPNAKSEQPKRQLAAPPKQRRDPMMGYAFQPSFGSYQSW